MEMMLDSPTNEQAKAGEVARDAIKLARELCARAIDGVQLDRELEQFILDHDCKPALKGYHPPFAQKPYEWTICLGLDQDVVHGVPKKFVGTENIVTVDLVVECDGWYADTARTFYNGVKHIEYKKFVDTSWAVFQAALGAVSPNESINVFSTMVEQGAGIYNYTVVNEYCGHGIGQGIHLPPQVLNKPHPTQGVFQPGQSYAVEPVLACQPTYTLKHNHFDGFSVTADCLVSHNEDTVFVGPNGVVNLTK